MTAIQLRAELVREMNPLLDNEVAMEKILVFVRGLVSANNNKPGTGWADRYVGAWKDNRNTDEIIDDLSDAQPKRQV